MQLDPKSVKPILAASCLALSATLAVVYGWGAALLLLAASALVLAISLFWKSLQGLTGEAEITLYEALELAAPTAEEEQKVAVLRALKDLEYERSVGKISEEDYTELSRHYRQQAKQLLRHLDEEIEPARKEAEREFDEHLKRLKLKEASGSPKRQGPSEEPEEADSAAPPSDSTPDSNSRICGECGSPNDVDASFCKKCGAKMSSEVEA